MMNTYLDEGQHCDLSVTFVREREKQKGNLNNKKNAPTHNSDCTAECDEGEFTLID